MYPGSSWRFEETRPLSGSLFLESKLYRWLGYPVILLNGKIGFRAFRPVYPDDVAAGLATIQEADVMSWHADRDIDSHTNRVVLGVDSGFGGGDASQIVTVQDAADQATTGEEAEIRESNTGLIGSLSGVRFAQGRASVFLRRFLDGPYQVTARLHPRKRAIQVGEDVLVTHSRFPSPASSTPGLAAKRMEVVERSEDFVSGQVEVVLQDANFVRPSFIGPSGALPGYDAATANEREHLYIGPAGTPVPNFDDGTPPYEII